MKNYCKKYYKSISDIKMTNSFEKKVISREMLYDISQLSERKYKANYFTKFLVLLSNYVTNQGEYSLCIKNLPADMYIFGNRLSREFHVSNVYEAEEYLLYFRSQGLIDYEIRAEHQNQDVKVYIRFLKFRDFLQKNIVDETSDFDKEKERFNINNHRGYFWIPAFKLVEFFFENQMYSHGIQDIFLFLYCLVTYKDDMTQDERIKNQHVANFGYSFGLLKENAQFSLLTYTQKFYITLNELASFFGIQERTLIQMLSRLQALGFIQKKFIRNKGTAIVFSCLEPLYNSSSEALERTFNFIKQVVLSIREKVSKVKPRFNLSNMLYRKEPQILNLNSMQQGICTA